MSVAESPSSGMGVLHDSVLNLKYCHVFSYLFAVNLNFISSLMKVIQLLQILPSLMLVQCLSCYILFNSFNILLKCYLTCSLQVKLSYLKNKEDYHYT